MTKLRLAGILLVAIALGAVVLVEAIGVPSSLEVKTAPKQTDDLSYHWYACYVPARSLAHAFSALLALAGLVCLAIPSRRRP